MKKKSTHYLMVCLIVCGSIGSSLATDLYSIANGNWSSGSTWSYTAGGPSCSCIPGAADNVFIQTNVILDVNLTGGAGIMGLLNIAAGSSLYTQDYDITIKAGGTLIVNGNLDVRDLEFQNGSHVLIASGAVVNVWGFFNNGNNSEDVTLDGTLILHGSCYNGNGGIIAGSGSVIYAEVCTGTGEWNVGMFSLPITLVSFTSNRMASGEMELKWTTATELNNDFFTLERSLNMFFFEPVAVVKGAGNSSKEIKYSVIDHQAPEQITYYRLKQTDLDGDYTFSPIIIGNKKEDPTTMLNVYPNPSAADNINVSVTGESNEEILVVVLDFLGREYYSKVVIIENGTYKFVVDPSKTLSPGVYMVTASAKNNKLYSQKIIVQ
jgi:hypothetical protein